MSIEDTIGYLDSSESCIVCGKGLRPGEALATLHQSESKLPICCPLCLEAYQKDPKPYLERLAKRALLRELSGLESPQTNKRFSTAKPHRPWRHCETSQPEFEARSTADLRVTVSADAKDGKARLEFEKKGGVLVSRQAAR